MNTLKSQYNIIVYDNTDTKPQPKTPAPPPHWYAEMIGADPNSLTWWWSLGGILHNALKNADAVGNAASWTEALQFAISAIEDEEQRTGQQVEVGVIQFWGHGGPGVAWMANEYLNADSVKEGSKHYNLLQKLKSKLIPGESAVWFRCCNAYTGPEGKKFATTYRDFFATKVISHTFLITQVQSGTYILEPGENPSWPDEEGYDENGSFIYSYPLAPHTITALKFYPPDRW